MVAPAVAAAAIPVGRKAVEFARQYYPQAVEQAKAYIAKSGKSMDNLMGRNGDVNAQGAVLTALASNGVDLAHFGSSTELTKRERELLARASAARGNMMRDESDKHKHLAVSEDFASKFDFFAIVEEVTEGTSISASMLYRMKLVMDRLDQNLVDEYLDKKRNGTRFARKG